MKVRILSGNQTGAVVDMPVKEAEANIATGFAEAVPEEAVPPPPPPRFGRKAKAEADDDEE